MQFTARSVRRHWCRYDHWSVQLLPLLKLPVVLFELQHGFEMMGATLRLKSVRRRVLYLVGCFRGCRMFLLML